MSKVKPQINMFYESQAQALSTLKHAGFMAGLVKDDLTGEYIKNPLTEEEILAIASSNKPYAWAYVGMAEKIKNKRSFENSK